MLWPDKHPFWHGSAHMDYVLATAGYDDAWVAADGCWLIDRRGQRYLDGRSGIGNMVLGYSRDDIADAMNRQARQLPFLCTMRYERAADVVIEHATALVEGAPEGLTRVRYCHTGSSAVEMAVLIARRYQVTTCNPERIGVLSLQGSYHGATHLTIAAGGIPPLQDAYGPMPEGFATVPRPPTSPEDPSDHWAPSFEVLRESVDRWGPDRIAAILVEPIEGLSGRALPTDYLRALRRFCDDHQILLIFDEVFSGLGRMGYLFAAEASGVSPDLLCVSKALAAGYAPLGAVLATDQIYEAFNAPMRYFAAASSTDAHPISCAAALATWNALQRGGLSDGRAVGSRLIDRLRAQLDHRDNVENIRGAGPYVAVDVVTAPEFPAMMNAKRHIQRECERRGVLIDYTPQTIMLTPPYVMTESEVDLLADTVADVVGDFRMSDVDPANLRPPTLRQHR